jgi:hypothetical protein
MALIAAFVAFFGAMIVGPWFSDPRYSSLSHVVSELAGQNMPGAWIMRAGFVAYGLGILAVSLPRLGTAPLREGPVVVFGLAFFAVAFWSHVHIVPEQGGDLAEDELHSLAAGVMGTAFGLACAARLFLPGGRIGDLFGWIGLIASVALPLAMLANPGVDGAIQRVMFAISAVWLWRAYAKDQVRT